MREIKFRAWHRVANQMYYTSDIKWINPSALYTDGTIAPAQEDRYLMMTLEGEMLDTVCERYSDMNGEVELMQYTGLKDKNGKEIYEGDIVAANPRYPYKVYWNNSSARFLLRSLSNGKNQGITSQKNVEVIGNIYENPELLKEPQ